jgi:hypothetical protein
MLVMYTDYDPIAAVLARCAVQFLSVHGAIVTASLKPDAAEWQNPHEWVQLNPKIPLMFFGHGIEAPAAFMSQAQSAFLDASATDLLSDRFICGVCCFSASVGAHAAGVGATLVGYQGALGVIIRPQYAGLLADCIMAGLRLVAAGDTAKAICRAMREAYEDTAQSLYRGSSLDCLVAPIFQGNAKALVVVGDAQRRP